MYEAKNGKICNFWTIWPVIQLINDHLQIWLRHICPPVHRFKKCYDISEVASVGGGEIVTALFPSMERWAKRLFVGF